MLPEGRSQNFGVRRHDCALDRRDMSRRGKAATCRRSPHDFSDKNWVCFFVLFEAEIDASCYIRAINLIFAIGFVL